MVLCSGFVDLTRTFSLQPKCINTDVETYDPTEGFIKDPQVIIIVMVYEYHPP